MQLPINSEKIVTISLINDTGNKIILKELYDIFDRTKWYGIVVNLELSYKTDTKDEEISEVYSYDYNLAPQGITTDEYCYFVNLKGKGIKLSK